MKRKLKLVLFAMAALAVLAAIPAAVKADPVSVSGDISITIAQGAMGTLNGIVTNLGPPRIYLNALDPSGGTTGITFDASPFAANTPLFLEPPPTGNTTGLVGFIDITVDASVGPGPYTGSFTVLGGDTPDSQNPLGTHSFIINVVGGAPSNIPEPATMFLLATGLGGAALAKRRAKRKGKTEAGI